MLRFVTIMLVTIILIMINGCELRRSNPLDPEGNSGIYAPPQVIWVATNPATASAPNAVSKFVQLRWNRNLTNTSGYYIYYSMAYNAAYSKINETGNESSTGDQIITHIQPDMQPGDYYFKVAAFKDYGHNGRLEGPLSDWVYVRVPN